MARNTFDNISKEMKNTYLSSTGQMFGKPCLKANGKAYAVLSGDDMAFKVGENAVASSKIKGAGVWNLNGKNWKEWLVVPSASKKQWSKLTIKALDFAK